MIKSKAWQKSTLVIIFITAVAVDLVSKYIATQLGKPLQNPGVAFSLFANESWAPYFFLGLNLVVGIAVLAFVLVKGQKFLQSLGLVLVSAGALGNCLDRVAHIITSNPPYVTDFIVYPRLFTGNIADIFVVAGAVLVAVGVVASSAVR